MEKFRQILHWIKKKWNIYSILALYLKNAYLDAFQNGQRVGEIGFEAPNSLNLSKFGDAEERIGYMMSLLFGHMTEDEANKAISSSKKKSGNK